MNLTICILILLTIPVGLLIFCLESEHQRVMQSNRKEPVEDPDEEELKGSYSAYFFLYDKPPYYVQYPGGDIICYHCRDDIDKDYLFEHMIRCYSINNRTYIHTSTSYASSGMSFPSFASSASAGSITYVSCDP